MVRVWDTKTGALLERFTGHTDSVYSVAFSPNGRSLVSGALDQNIKIWDLSDATLNYLSSAGSSGDGSSLPPPPPEMPLVTTTCRHTFRGHKDYVLSVAFVGTNGAFGRVDARGNPVATLGSDALAEVEWVISGGKDWGVTFWDARTGVSGNAAAQFVLQGHTNSGTCVSSRERLLTSSCTVISVSPAPTGGIFATGAGDFKARIWRVCSSVGGPATGPATDERPRTSSPLKQLSGEVVHASAPADNS